MVVPSTIFAATDKMVGAEQGGRFFREAQLRTAGSGRGRSAQLIASIVLINLASEHSQKKRSVRVFTQRTFTSPGPWPLSAFNSKRRPYW